MSLQCLNEAIVIGPGRVGFALSYFLSRHWGKVALVGRAGPVLPSDSWNVEEELDHRLLYTYPLTTLNTPKAIFFAVKAPQLLSALNQHQNILDCFPEARVISLSNGLLTPLFADLKRTRTNLKLELGTTTLASRVEPKTRRISITNPKPEICIQGKKNVWPTTVVHAGSLSLKPVEDIQFHHVKKWCFNVLINVFSAYKKLSKNGDLLNFAADLQKIADELSVYVKEKFGIDLTSATLFNETLQLIDLTRDNVNSLLFDLKNSRPTELDFLIRDFDFQTYPALHRLQSYFYSA